VNDLRRASPPTPTREPRQERPGSADRVPAPDSFGSGRRYDVALSMVDDREEGTAVPAPVDVEEVTEVMAAPEPAGSSPSSPEPQERPPPGAPTVRPAVARQRPETVPQELLETAADSAMLSTNPDGTTSFEIAFSDDLFDNLACRISFVDGRIVATFRVADDNTRRLLEAESRALVARLEDRGLKVQQVRVESSQPL
jgi:hypothetical protein